MNIEQLLQAQKRTKELIIYNTKNGYIREFIERIEEYKAVNLSTYGTMNGRMMWGDEKEIFDMIGGELIELLQRKLTERENYLEKLQTDDLIRSEQNEH